MMSRSSFDKFRARTAYFCFTASPAPARRRFTCGRFRGAAAGAAGGDPGAGDRVDGADDPAVRRTFPRQGDGVAQRAERRRAVRRLAAGADEPSRGAGGRRLPLGALSALPEPGPDRAGRGARAVVQTGAHTALSRRTVAVELGRLWPRPVLLGSATPSLETFYAARRGGDRVVGAAPADSLGRRER